MDERKVGNNQEDEVTQETENRRAESLEKKKIKKYLESHNFSPENEEISSEFILTPAEHQIIGSTFDGKGYHLNQPMAITGGVSLERINLEREKYNQETRQLPFILTCENDRLAIVYFRILPLTQEDISDQNYRMTFKLDKIVDLDKLINGVSEEIIDIPTNVIKEYVKELEKNILDTQTKERENLNQKIT